MPTEEKFVILERNMGSHQLKMLTDLLREEGINARGIGSISGAAIGVGEVIMGGRLEVPESQEAEAKVLLEHYQGDLDQGEYVDVPPELTATEPLSEQKGLVLTDEEERSQQGPRKFALFFMGSFLLFLVVWATIDFFKGA